MLDSRAFEMFASFSSIRATLALFIIGYAVHWYFRSLPSKPKFPKADLDGNDWFGSLVKATSKFQDRPFLFGVDKDEAIFLPNYLFEEVKDLPDDKLSMRQHAKTILNGKYTGLGENVGPVAESLKNELTMNINLTLALLHDEIRYAVEEGIGDCPHWTPVKIHQKNLRIVALSAMRIFVGRPLCRDEEWLKLVINFTVNSAKAIKEVRVMKPWLRPFLTPFSPSIRKAVEYRRRVAAKLKPQLTDMIEAAKNAGKYDDDQYAHFVEDDQHTLAIWSMSHYEPGQIPTAESVADSVLLGSYGGIHTTTTTLTNILYDLAAHPEYQQVLREEIEQIAAEEPDGQFRKKTLPKLRKLDSFIKESQRMNPLGLVLIFRLVTAPEGIKLSSGDYLPRNSVVQVGQPRQTSALDSKYLSPMPPQPSLDEFYPWRFSDMRSYPGEENKHQFVTTTIDSLYFGHGVWSCPGRFFASNQIKAILIQLLRRYDIGVGPAGQGEVGEWKRPPTHNVDLVIYPEPTAEIYFRNRKV